MATPARSPERLLRSDERAGVRKAVVDSGLITVEMCPAGFGLMLNVSDHGIGVYTLKSLQAGEEVQVSFLLPGMPKRIDCAGQVRWASNSHAGLHLQHPDPRTDSELRRWISTLPALPAPENPSSHRREFPAFDEQVHDLETRLGEGNLTRDEALQLLVARMLDLTHASGAAIGIAEAGEMVCRASAGLAPEVGVQIASDTGITGECIRSGQTIYCEDTELDPRVDREACWALDLRSSLLVPVMQGQNVAGVLELFSPNPAAFGPDHRWLAQRLAVLTAQLARDEAMASAASPQVEVAAPKIPPKSTRENIIARPTVAPIAEPVEEIDILLTPNAEPESNHRQPRLNHQQVMWLLIVLLILTVLAVVLFLRPSAKAADVRPVAAISAPTPTNVVPPTTTQPAEEQHESRGRRNGRTHPKAVGAAPTEEVAAMIIPRGTDSLRREEPPATAAPELHVAQTTSLPGVALPMVNSAPQLKQRVATVSGGKLMHRVEPEYPSLALRKRIEGDVVLQARINKDGTVGRVRQVQGSPVLGSAAITAVRQWRYEPLRRDNEAQEMDSTITIQFHIPKPVWLR